MLGSWRTYVLVPFFRPLPSPPISGTMKPLLVSWVCDWAACASLKSWILASWLVVTRRLPDNLRPQLGIGSQDSEAIEDEDHEGDGVVCGGEVVESDEDDDDIVEEAEGLDLDESVARAVSLGLRARR